MNKVSSQILDEEQKNRNEKCENVQTVNECTVPRNEDANGKTERFQTDWAKNDSSRDTNEWQDIAGVFDRFFFYFFFTISTTANIAVTVFIMQD